MIVIGLHGDIGSGKDTIADILIERHGFHRLAFKTKLVDDLCHIFGVGREVFELRELKDVPNERLFGHTPRHVMRTYGTDWGRNMISRRMWLEPVSRVLKAGTWSKVVIPDVRFPDELALIYAYSGQVFHVLRPDNPFKQESTHESDQSLAGQLSGHILNGGTMEHLQDLVDELGGMKYDT